MSNPDAAYFINTLGLQPHPEGGWYKQTYQAQGIISALALPSSFKGPRAFSSAIYYLLQGDDVSHFHRICSDELWHFYAGSALTVYMLDARGQSSFVLGPDSAAGQGFQGLVTAGSWFAAALNDTRGFALLGCTVAPAFDFADFTLAKREELLQSYPDHQELILRLS